MTINLDFRAEIEYYIGMRNGINNPTETKKETVMLKRALEQIGNRILKLEISGPGEDCYYVARVKNFQIVKYEACYQFRATRGERYAARRAARARLLGR